MPVRRSADPISIQHVWDAIKLINSQKQVPDLSRVVKYLQRVDKCTSTQGELYVQQAVLDGLIVEIHKISGKGSRAGEEVEKYRMPMQESPTPKNDGKDWYCIDCHLAGDVNPCISCHRVFHTECAHKNKNSINESPFINLNSLVEKKKPNYVPIIDSLPHSFANGSNLNKNMNLSESFTDGVKKNTNLSESFIDGVYNQDVNLNQLFENVEKKLEKMESLNTAGYDSINSANGELIEMSKETVTPVKENLHCSKRNVDKVYDEQKCHICNFSDTDTDLQLDKDELNYLLSFVYNRVRSWVPVEVTDTVPPEAKPEWLSDRDIKWRVAQLLFQPMSMPMIAAKLKRNEYENISHFKADIFTVKHNIAIFHGIESQEYACAEYLWKDSLRELLELSNCVDCYKYSNEKFTSKWFCLPCRVPHKLVWAKQKGYPYWPAKVLRETVDTCDVRFFGGKYERSVLPKSLIKPITMKFPQPLKKGTSFRKAIEEINLHQRLLKNPIEAERYYINKRKRPFLKSMKDSQVSSTPILKKRSRSVDSLDFEDLSNPGDVGSSDNKKELPMSPIPKVCLTRIEYPFKGLVQTYLNKKKAARSETNGTALPETITINDSDEKSPFSDEENQSRCKDNNDHEVAHLLQQDDSQDSRFSRENPDRIMPETERQYCEAVEKARRKLEQCNSKENLIKLALECMQAEIDRIKDKHDEYIKKIFDSHNLQISETKKKQWCFNCEQDAIYHCCWNTAYCSLACQQQHWQAEHKKVCRRKR